MWRFGVLALWAANFVSLTSAQASTTLAAATTYTPTGIWYPQPTCSQGNTAATTQGVGNYGGGIFEDYWGTFWELDCGYSYSGTTYMDGTYVGTFGNGIVACFYGCSLRIGCMGFTYVVVAGQNTGLSGSGRC